MADEKNDDQSLAEYAKAHGLAGSKFTVPKDTITNDTLAVPAPDEGTSEYVKLRTEFRKEKEKETRADLGKFLEHVGAPNEGEAELYHARKKLGEAVRNAPAEPDSGFMAKMKSGYEEAMRNIQGTVGLATQLEGEAKGVDAKAKNVAQYKKNTPGM